MRSVTSYPNTNVCLGITKGSLAEEKDGAFVGREGADDGLFAYTTGLYTSPHEFQAARNWDEICIDFHPCGYYHFFDVPSQPKIITEGFTNDLFNAEDQRRLLNIFAEKSIRLRAAAVEEMLLSKLKLFEKSDLQEAVSYIHARSGAVTVKELITRTRCSERKLYRLFDDYFGTTPKWYIRIFKIRKALQLMAFNPGLSLTSVAYQVGYADQSHFIREAKIMCNLLPKNLKSNLISIDNEVIVGRS